MPRYEPLGTDIGKKLWNQWTAICSTGVKRFLVLDRTNGGALILNEFHRAVKSSLSTHSGMSNPDIYSSYSSKEVYADHSHDERGFRGGNLRPGQMARQRRQVHAYPIRIKH